MIRYHHLVIADSSTEWRQKHPASRRSIQQRYYDSWVLCANHTHKGQYQYTSSRSYVLYVCAVFTALLLQKLSPLKYPTTSAHPESVLIPHRNYDSIGIHIPYTLWYIVTACEREKTRYDSKWNAILTGTRILQSEPDHEKKGKKEQIIAKQNKTNNRCSEERDARRSGRKGYKNSNIVRRAEWKRDNPVCTDETTQRRQLTAVVARTKQHVKKIQRE